MIVLALAAGALAVVTPTAAASPTGSAVDLGVGCGAHALARNDDGSTPAVSLPFKLNFYNHTYTSLYVNNNGNVTFQAPMATYTPFTITANTPPIIAPFFADVDTRNSLSHIVGYGPTTFQGRPAFCVNWLHVGYFGNHVNKTDTFQLILVNDNAQGDFDIVFNYGAMQWETGDASGGGNGQGGTPAGAGFSNGDGNPNHFVQLPGSLVPGGLIDGSSATALSSHSNVTPAVRGRYVYHIASGTQVSRTNVCTPYYFVSVAGSNEPPAGPDDVNASPETKAVFAGLKSNYAQWASNVTFYQIPYPALAVTVLMENLTVSNASSRFFDVNVPKYLGSIAEGYSTLVGYLDSVHRTCAAQHISPKFFLVGYSQGALVIHKYLLNLSSNDPVRSEIAFAGLIADPAAVKGRSELINYGTASDANDYGVCHETQNVAGADLCGTGNQDIPATFRGKTESICDVNDAVCDTSTLTSGFVGGWYTKLKAGVPVHVNYPSREASGLANMGKSILTINHIH